MAQPPEVISLCPTVWQAHYRKLWGYPRCLAWGAEETPLWTPSPDGSAAQRSWLRNLTLSAPPCTPGLARSAHPMTTPRGPHLSSPNAKNPGRHLTRVFQMSLEIGWINMSGMAVPLDALDCNLPRKAWVQIPALVLIGHVTLAIHLTSPRL